MLKPYCVTNSSKVKFYQFCFSEILYLKYSVKAAILVWLILRSYYIIWVQDPPSIQSYFLYQIECHRGKIFFFYYYYLYHLKGLCKKVLVKSYYNFKFCFHFLKSKVRNQCLQICFIFRLIKENRFDFPS